MSDTDLETLLLFVQIEHLKTVKYVFPTFLTVMQSLSVGGLVHPILIKNKSQNCFGVLLKPGVLRMKIHNSEVGIGMLETLA